MMSTHKQRDWAKTLRELIKFGIVGGSGFVVNILVAIVLNKMHGGTAHAQDVLFNLFGTRWNFRFTSLVWIVAFLVANVFNFQLNRSWTFKRDVRRGWWAEFGPFFLVGSVAAVAGLFIKVALTNPTSPVYLPEGFFHESAGLHSREYWSQIITIVVTMPINFAVNKLWTFRAVKSHEGQTLAYIEADGTAARRPTGAAESAGDPAAATSGSATVAEYSR